MKSARLTALVLALTLVGSLSGLAALHSPKAHPRAAALVTTPLAVAPSPVPPQRASRSRAVAPTRVLTPKSTPARVNVKPKPLVQHHYQPRAKVTTRRFVGGSHYGGIHDITMYCGGGTTASGKPVREGMVATLDRSIPFGTVVQIEGMGSYVVEDRIGHGSEFDIYTSSCSYARQFGRHHLRVTF